MKLPLLALTSAVLLLTGCEDNVKPNEPQELNFKMPVGLKDCKTYRVSASAGFNILVTRCPNSSTTTEYGKGTKSVVVEKPDDDLDCSTAAAEQAEPAKEENTK